MGWQSWKSANDVKNGQMNLKNQLISWYEKEIAIYIWHDFTPAL